MASFKLKEQYCTPISKQELSGMCSQWCWVVPSQFLACAGQGPRPQLVYASFAGLKLATLAEHQAEMLQNNKSFNFAVAALNCQETLPRAILCISLSASAPVVESTFRNLQPAVTEWAKTSPVAMRLVTDANTCVYGIPVYICICHTLLPSPGPTPSPLMPELCHFHRHTHQDEQKLSMKLLAVMYTLFACTCSWQCWIRLHWLIMLSSASCDELSQSAGNLGQVRKACCLLVTPSPLQGVPNKASISSKAALQIQLGRHWHCL